MGYIVVVMVDIIEGSELMTHVGVLWGYGRMACSLMRYLCVRVPPVRTWDVLSRCTPPLPDAHITYIKTLSFIGSGGANLVQSHPQESDVGL